MWFTGDIGSAVATVKNESKILLVFGLGNDELSKEVDSIFQKSSQNLSNVLGDKCICLKLEEDSEGFKQFCAFWPILTTPIIYFITGSGQKLCDPLIGDRICESSIVHAITPSTTTNTSNTQASNMPSTSKMEPEKGETEEERKERIAAKSEEYREKIDAVREKKGKDFKETEKQKETERRETGQKVADIKRQQEEDQLVASAKEKRKDKKIDAEHLKKLRAQIAEDRANKSKEFEEESKEEREKKEEHLRQVKNESIRVERERLEDQRKMRDTMARIQFRFSDGSSHSTKFEATQKLADARTYVVENGLSTGSFIFGVALPRRRFNEDDESKDFRSLGLTPSSVLTVIPVGGGGGSGGGSFFAMILSVLYIPIDMLISFLNGIFGRQNPAVQNQPAQNQRPAGRNPHPTARRRRPGEFSDDDDQATYNGNSTEQL